MPAKRPNIKVPLDPKVLDALIERNLTYIEGLADDTRKKILDKVSDALVKGDDIWSLRDELMELGFDEKRAEFIARTETMYALNTGTIERYKESGWEYVMWLTAIDNRTCQDLEIELPWGESVYGCEAMNGLVFKIGEKPDNPIHVNCRCAWVPADEDEYTGHT